MIVAERYANSLMEIARERGSTEEVRRDMLTVAALCRDNRDFGMFLESPVIKTDKKVKVLESIFKGKINEISYSFLLLIASKHREKIMKEIADAFETQYKRDRNILTAVITSAHGLDEATRKKVMELVRSQSKGEVDLVEKVDPAAIGGFVLRIGDKQVDRTVARQLADMRKQLRNKGLN